VVLVVFDSLAAGHVSHLGYDRLTTPNLDALARDGVSFEQAITPASYTVASIPSLLTGRLPDRHGLTWYDKRLPTTETTVTELFRQAGYSTFAGVSILNGGAVYGNMQGFDEYVETYLGAAGPGGETIEHKGRLMHLARADEFLPLVRERLDRLRDDERLFLYLHVLEPHVPYDPPLAYKQHFEDERFPGPYQEGDRKRLQGRLGRGELDQEVIEGVAHLYDSNVFWADENLGKLLDELRERGLYEDALVLVTADHGEAFWQHGLQSHGKQLYEEEVRVPMVVKLPAGRKRGGIRLPHLVSTLDILPSLCDWLELPLPPADLDGRSFAPIVNDPRAAAAREAVFLRSREDTRQFGLRLPHAKAILHLPADPSAEPSLELYDLRTDPAELEDLAPTRPEQAARLRGTILEFLETLAGDEAAERRPFEEVELLLLEELGYAGVERDE
jgi:arylsulfatase